MASLSLCPQFETNLMSNRKVIELLLQLKSAKAHGKNYINVKPPLVRHLFRNCQLTIIFCQVEFLLRILCGGCVLSTLIFGEILHVVIAFSA